MKKCLPLSCYAFVLLIIGISACSTSEKSSETDSLAVQVDSIGSINTTEEILSSKEKVHWTNQAIYYHTDYLERNAIAINFNDSSKVIDTLAFRKALGAEAKIKRFIDTTDYNLLRIVMTYKQSEICLFQFYDYGPKAMIFSALIRDKEIVLKNGVRVGLTKQEVLSKYPNVKVPADVIYLKDGDDSILRLEFKMNLLVYMEYWPESSLIKSFGGLDIYQVSEAYNPFKSDLDVKYFVDLLGNKTAVEKDTIVSEAQTERGDPVKLYSYRYLVTNENTQIELMDHSGAGTYLSFLSAIISTPKIVLKEGIQVGMSKQKFLEHFGLQGITSGYKTLWINSRGGKIRATFDNEVVTSLELGNGRIGRVL